MISSLHRSWFLYVVFSNWRRYDSIYVQRLLARWGHSTSLQYGILYQVIQKLASKMHKNYYLVLQTRVSMCKFMNKGSTSWTWMISLPERLTSSPASMNSLIAIGMIRWIHMILAKVQICHLLIHHSATGWIRIKLNSVPWASWPQKDIWCIMLDSKPTSMLHSDIDTKQCSNVLTQELKKVIP